MAKAPTIARRIVKRGTARGLRRYAREVIWLFIVKAVALCFVAWDSWRSRFRLGLVAVSATAYLVAAPVSALLPSPNLPLGALLVHFWWLVPVLLPFLSWIPCVVAWRALSDMSELDPRRVQMDRVAMGFLGNGLLDLGVLLAIGIGVALFVRSGDF